MEISMREQPPTNLNSSQYLTAASLLKGPHAIHLPVSAGLPSSKERTNSMGQSVRKSHPASELKSRTRIPVPETQTSNVNLKLPPHFSRNSRLFKSISIISATGSIHSEQQNIQSSVVVIGGNKFSQGLEETPKLMPKRRDSNGIKPTGDIKYSKAGFNEYESAKKGSPLVLWSSVPVPQDTFTNSSVDRALRSSNTSRKARFVKCCDASSECSSDNGNSIQGGGNANQELQAMLHLGARMKSLMRVREFCYSIFSFVSAAHMHNLVLCTAATENRSSHIALQIQQQLERARKQRESEKRMFLQQRAELVCLNQIIGVVERFKFEQFKSRKMSHDPYFGHDFKETQVALQAQLDRVVSAFSQVGGDRVSLIDLVAALEVNTASSNAV
ncbi:hypothetical protein BJ741DRAFT_620153 [Chytriomyces cf. hyalinus JEL632]|nr:hypothetical protein BJ741DRAFT_620153 [Chytriomyces cf. hyalinus JEL632]